MRLRDDPSPSLPKGMFSEEFTDFINRVYIYVDMHTFTFLMSMFWISNQDFCLILLTFVFAVLSGVLNLPRDRVPR